MASHLSTSLIICLFIIGCAVATTTSCWTCAPGWTHWYDLGLAAPTNGDQCQCIQNTATTTKPTASSPTTAASANCWTCPSGYTHWYDLGLPQPSDPCECVLNSAPTAAASKTTTTTAKPGTTTTAAPARNCWTCAAGWSHWYDLGLSAPTNGDQCQCIQNSGTTTTAKPTSAATTTTAKPGTTTTAAPARNCWTCSPGWSHWYDLGLSAPTNGDQCQCIQQSSGTTTTASPTSSSGSSSSGSTTSAMSAFITAMTPNSAGGIGSISFSPGVNGYSSSNPPPLSLVGQLMDNLISSTKYRVIQLYYIDASTIALAAARGLKVLGIVYVTPGQDNSALINAAISAVRQYPSTFIALACGNEMGANYGLTSSVVSAVSQCVSGLKGAGITIPIGSIDVYYSWCSQNEGSCNTAWSAVGNLVDWIGMNDYPWYDDYYSGVTPCNTYAQAAQVTYNKHKKLQALYGKPVVLTEFGWPGSGTSGSIMSTPNDITGQQCGVGSDANQKSMVQSVIDLYRANGLPCNTFEAYRESWKGAANSPEVLFGICNGTPPYACFNQPQ